MSEAKVITVVGQAVTANVHRETGTLCLYVDRDDKLEAVLQIQIGREVHNYPEALMSAINLIHTEKILGHSNVEEKIHLYQIILELENPTTGERHHVVPLITAPDEEEAKSRVMDTLSRSFKGWVLSEQAALEIDRAQVKQVARALFGPVKGAIG